MRYKGKMIILYFLIILKLYIVCKIFIKSKVIKYNKKNLLKKILIKIFSLNWEYIIIFNNFIGVLEVFIYQKSYPKSNEFNQAKIFYVKYLSIHIKLENQNLYNHFFIHIIIYFHQIMFNRKSCLQVWILVDRGISVNNFAILTNFFHFYLKCTNV